MTHDRHPVWHPFTQHALAGEAVPIARSEGAWLEQPDGRRILDAISSWWVITHGHRHPHVMAAIRAASEHLDQVIFAGFTHAPAEALARKLLAVSPAGLAHVFYSDSGSTAVEVGLKMALGTFRNRREARTTIVSFEHAYHGDTVGAMSAGARGVFNDAYAPLLFDVARIPFPYAGAEQATVDALEAHCRGGAVAALVIEPLVLGAGGMLMYPAWVLGELKRVCERHGVLLVADEVMTGWGRTGSLFASMQAGISPDILCTAKGLTAGALPLAATLATTEIFEAHYSADRTRTLFHSSSYTANPIACAAGLANIEVWEREPVAARVSRLGELQAERLGRLSGHRRLTRARRTGTIAAIDLEVADAGYLAASGPRLYAFFLERGVLLRPLGSTIYVMPPYCTTETELDLVYDAIAEAADALV
jgi:adenosylmethionine-8-amino-7-oxononanoate aminotransferase